jgi:hypothetical protein
MKNRKGEGYTIDSIDRLEFHGLVLGTYYRIVSEAIKKYDSNHLYLGSRLHGAAKYKNPIFREAGKYVDVVSVNYYSRWNPEQETLKMWLEESGKPFIITEFYAKAYDVGLSNSSGAGYPVATQTDRAIFFENFVIGLLESRGNVGWHWHRFDDTNTSNKGFINADSKWYFPLMDSFYKIASDVYNIRNFLVAIPEGKGAAFFQYRNFDGYAVSLPAGNYTKIQLENNGVTNKKISSLKIKEGFKVIVYLEDNFSGNSIEITNDLYSFSDSIFENNVSSLKIVDLRLGGISAKNQNPDVFTLNQNYPNPFISTTQINYQLWKSTNVQLRVYDILGKKVRTLVKSMKQAGNYSIGWSSLNDEGLPVPSGLYICQMNVKVAQKEYIQQRKMLLLK